MDVEETVEFTPRGEFMTGIRETIPMMVGAAPFGLIFGVLGISSGLSAMAVLGFSLIVFAGSAQFIAAGLIAQGVGVGFIILTTFIVNLRHALYSASLGPYVKKLSQKWMIPLAFWLTDETYAVVIGRYERKDKSPYKHWYHLGSSIAMYLNWQTWTIIGLIAGTQLANVSELGLDIAMVVTFIGIVIPLVVTRPMLACAVVAGIVAVVANPLPNKMGIIVAAFAGIAAGIIVESMQTKRKVDEGKITV